MIVIAWRDLVRGRISRIASRIRVLASILFRLARWLQRSLFVLAEITDIMLGTYHLSFKFDPLYYLASVAYPKSYAATQVVLFMFDVDLNRRPILAIAIAQLMSIDFTIQLLFSSSMTFPKLILTPLAVFFFPMCDHRFIRSPLDYSSRVTILQYLLFFIFGRAMFLAQIASLDSSLVFLLVPVGAIYSLHEAISGTRRATISTTQERGRGYRFASLSIFK